MAESRDRKVVFYRAKPRLDSDVWPAGIYPIEDVLEEVDTRSALAGEDRYVIASRETMYGLVIASPPGTSHLVVYRIRRTRLPNLERDGVIGPLELAKNANLAEPSQWIFFEENIVGTIAGRDGPRRTLTANFLQKVVPQGRPTIQFAPIIHPDVLQKLQDTGDIVAADIRIQAGFIDELAQRAPGLRRALRQTSNTWPGTGSIEVLLRPGSTDAERQQFSDASRGSVPALVDTPGLDKLRLTAKDDGAPQGTEVVDLLAEEIATYRVVELQGDSRHVDPGAAQEAVISAYNELLPLLQVALSVTDG